MTQSTVHFEDIFEERHVSEIEVFDFNRTANPDLVRNSTFNQKRLYSVSDLSENTLFEVEGDAFNSRRNCSPSDYAVQAVKSFWKKLRN